MEVLTDLDLEERRDLPIHKLSGGQLKRVSIGVELLTKPRLFFLDEPTSGLDPGTEYNMMRLLRKLADQGRTIVLITHATKNVMMCDKVIILVRGGRVAFFGPPEEALVYFDQYRTDYERRIKDMEFDDIYTILEDEKRGEPEQWDERFRASPAYRKYVVDRLQSAQAGAVQMERAAVRQKPAKRVSALRQFTILSLRNLNIMTQDKASLALMLALSPMIGLAGFMWGRQLFSTALGDAFNIITMLFMMGLIAILVGAMASVREIVKEIDIYKRERAIALKIGPYVFSKLWVGVVLALYQALVFIITKALFVGYAPPQLNLFAWVGVFITLFIGSFSGYLMGLAISAGSPNQMVALLMVILVLVPQFLFAGALMPLDLIPGGRIISAAATTRWAFGAFVRLSDVGEQLADDDAGPRIARWMARSGAGMSGCRPPTMRSWPRAPVWDRTSSPVAASSQASSTPSSSTWTNRRNACLRAQPIAVTSGSRKRCWRQSGPRAPGRRWRRSRWRRICRVLTRASTNPKSVLPRRARYPPSPNRVSMIHCPTIPTLLAHDRTSRRPWSSASPSARRSWAIRMGLRSASRGCAICGRGCGMPVRG